MTERAGIDPSYLEKGTRIGAYEIVDKLGTGGFGYLWKVRRDGKLYALKVGRQRLADLDAEDRKHYQERLDREIAALKTVHHPNIVRVHSFEWWPELDGGFPYLVMDFVDGRPLYPWRESEAPSLVRICGVFEKLAAAIEHIHALGLFHRDLKSDNVLVRGDGEPVIIDFGIARPRLALDLTRAASVGTVTYYAPEYARFCDSAAFARGEPFDWRPTTDLHAVGYMLYRVLTGHRPFPADDAALESEGAVLFAIKSEVPPHPSDVDPRLPRSLGDVAMALLEKDPAQRLQSARELADRLAAARTAAATDQAWVAPFDVPRLTAGERVARQEAPEGGPGVDVAEQLPDPQPGRCDEAGPAEVRASETPQERKRDFDAPTRAEARQFVPEEVFPAVEPRDPPTNGLPSAVREAKARLAAGAPRRGPARLAIAGAALVVGAGVGIAALAALQRPAERPPSVVANVPAREPSGRAPAPSTQGRAADLPPRRESASAPPPPSDADAIDEELAREFGRPRVLPDGRLEMRPASSGRATARTTPASAQPEPDQQSAERPEPTKQDPTKKEGESEAASREPPWLMRSTKVATAPGATAPAPAKPRGVPLGAHLRAKLLSNLDSRTIGNGPVEAILVAPYLLRGDVVVPARTLVYGTASEGNGRFNVRFTRLRMPDDTEVEFEGLALARDDGKPGLAAARRIQGEPERQPGIGAKIAKGTGNILLDTISGGVGHDVVRGAGQTALNHEKQAESGSGWTLLLDAGVAFDVWVERAF
jgi:serine/threonine-protein kinase